MRFEFDWDDRKAAANLAKHGISFEQAVTAFDDPEFLDVYDAAHSASEDRWIRIGLSDCGVLAVVYTARKGRHRIISARRANREERRLYHETERKN